MTNEEHRTLGREEFINGLREMADFYEANPEAPMPWMPYEVNIFADTQSELLAMRRAMQVSNKHSVGDWLYFVKKFGPVEVHLNINKSETCERVKVGTRIEPAQPEREVEVFEWRCDNPLLAQVQP